MRSRRSITPVTAPVVRPDRRASSPAVTPPFDSMMFRQCRSVALTPRRSAASASNALSWLPLRRNWAISSATLSFLGESFGTEVSRLLRYLLPEKCTGSARRRKDTRVSEMKLELIPVPVTDVDRAKAFYSEQVGFNADHDHEVSDEIRFVQLTPPGSACSIAVGTGIINTPPGSVHGLQLVVSDIEAACAELV